MFRYIDNLRNKPRGEKNRLAFSIAFAITIIIASLWLFNLITVINGEKDYTLFASPMEILTEQFKTVIENE